MNTNVKHIQTTKRLVFRYWLEFLKPYHHLAAKEIEALSILLYYRQELSTEVSNPDLVDKLLFSSSTRKQVKKDLGDMKDGVFNNLLTTLRRKNVLSKDNKIVAQLIPKMQKDSDGFKLIFNFEITDEVNIE